MKILFGGIFIIFWSISLFANVPTIVPPIQPVVGYKTCEACFISMFFEALSKISDNAVNISIRDFDTAPTSRRIADTILSKSFGRSKYNCWGGSADILYSSGVVNNLDSLWARYARESITVMKRRGFINLMDPKMPLHNTTNLCLAPRGSVLVFDGPPEPTMVWDEATHAMIKLCGDVPCGHTEVKLGGIGEPDVASDYRSHFPITGSCSVEGGGGYKLKAIMVAPQVISEVYQGLIEFSKNAKLN